MRNSLITFLLLLLCTSSALAQRQDSALLKTATGSIYGTLTTPSKAKAPFPLIIIIPGSGPTDRHGNNGVMVNNTLRILSDSLVKAGIATLRFDKRGIGSSKAAAPSESKLAFTDYVTDLNSWIAKFGKDRRFNKIIVAGHSEGSLVGILSVKNAPVSAFISIAGPGKPADELILEQLQAAEMPKPMFDSTVYFFTELRKSGHVDNVPPGFYQSLFRPTVQPYLLSWIKYNPSVEMAGVAVPTLIIQGTSDIQVDTNQARLLANAKPDAQLLIIPGMNHVFRDAPADDKGKNLATYYDADMAINSELVRAMVRFVKDQAGKKQ